MSMYEPDDRSAVPHSTNNDTDNWQTDGTQSCPCMNQTTGLSQWAHLHVVGMLQFMSHINKPSLPTPFYSVLVSISVFMALSTVFHSINSPDNSPFSDSNLPVLSLPYWSFQPYISMKVSFSPDIIPSG